MNAALDLMSEESDYSQDYINYVLKHNKGLWARYWDCHIVLRIISETPKLQPSLWSRVTIVFALISIQ